MIEVIVALVGIIAIIIGVLLYSAFSWGYVTYKFWMWFLLPVFPQMPHITIWQAIGLGLFIMLFRNQTDPNIKDEYRNKPTEWWVAILSPWVTLCVGYGIYCWIK